MDWQIIREIRFLLIELPNVRFWAVWILLVILTIGYVLHAIWRGNEQPAAVRTSRTCLLQNCSTESSMNQNPGSYSKFLLGRILFFFPKSQLKNK